MKNITFADYSAKFFDDGSRWVLLQAALGRVYGRHYLSQMQGRVKNYLSPAFGEKALSEVTGLEVAVYLAKLEGRAGAGRATGFHGRPISESSKRKILDCARIIFEFAALEGVIDHDPLATVGHFLQRGERAHRKTA